MPPTRVSGLVMRVVNVSCAPTHSGISEYDVPFTVTEPDTATGCVKAMVDDRTLSLLLSDVRSRTGSPRGVSAKSIEAAPAGKGPSPAPERDTGSGPPTHPSGVAR